MAAIINIPQRLQTVNGVSAIEAGFHLLPLLLCSLIAITLAEMIVLKIKVAPLYLLIAGDILQTVGEGLFSSLSRSDSASLIRLSSHHGIWFWLQSERHLDDDSFVVQQKDRGMSIRHHLDLE